MKARIVSVFSAFCFTTLALAGAAIAIPPSATLNADRAHIDAANLKIDASKYRQLSGTWLQVLTQAESAGSPGKQGGPGQISLPPSPPTKAKWDDEISTTYGADKPEGLSKMPNALTFHWASAKLDNPSNKKVTVAYQILNGPSGDVIGSGTVGTSLGNPATGGTFVLDNGAWKNVTWSKAAPNTEYNGPGAAAGTCTIYVRMTPMAGGKEIAPASDTVKIEIFHLAPIG